MSDQGKGKGNGTSLRILSVGQCGFDSRRLSEFLGDEFGARVESLEGLDELREAIRRGPARLVLVNRILDVDGSSGIALIERLREEAGDSLLRSIPLMLVSDLPEAQEAAEAAGAHPGFGKSELRSPEALRRLKALLD